MIQSCSAEIVSGDQGSCLNPKSEEWAPTAEPHCTDSPPRLLEGCLLCMLVSQLGSGSHWVTPSEDSRGYRVEWVGTDQTKASRFCFSAETVLLLLPVLHIHLLCGVFSEERTHEHEGNYCKAVE